jgi:serine/threonine-protein kinase
LHHHIYFEERITPFALTNESHRHGSPGVRDAARRMLDCGELDHMIGESIGSYVIDARLGGGGMGEVFLATHRRLHRRVAIKVLLPAYSRDPGLVARLFTEARATSLIDHPGIVQIVDCDVLPSGHAYIVMEYLRGETLRQCLERVGRLTDDVPAAIELAVQIAGALGAAHDKGIIHRDLKPDNVFLSQGAGGREGITVKILDFGIAKLVADGAGSVSLTRTGSLLGTPLYMSPEQCRNAARLDHRTDIYSLGCIVFEMMCGRPPFVHESMGDLIIAHGTEIPPSPSELGVALPEGLESLIARMLAKSPDDRPQTMKDVVTALRSAIGSAPAAYSTLRLETRPLPVWAGTPPPTPAQLSSPTPGQLSSPTPAPRVPTPVRYGGVMAPTGPVESMMPSGRTTLAQTSGEMERLPVRRSRAPLVLTFLVLAAGGAGGFLYVKANQRVAVPVEPPPPVPVPAVRPPPVDPEPPPPPRSSLITVQVQGGPAGVEVTVDGKRASIPIRLRRDSQSKELVFSAPGYRDQVEVIAPESDQILKLSMQKVPKPAPPERPRRVSRDRPASPTPAVAPAPRPVDPPAATTPPPQLPKKKLPTPLNDL